MITPLVCVKRTVFYAYSTAYKNTVHSISQKLVKPRWSQNDQLFGEATWYIISQYWFNTDILMKC